MHDIDALGPPTALMLVAATLLWALVGLVRRWRWIRAYGVDEHRRAMDDLARAEHHQLRPR